LLFIIPAAPLPPDYKTKGQDAENGLISSTDE